MRLSADIALAPLDGLRRGIFRRLGPLSGPYVRSRELRVALLGLMTVAVAFTTTALAPLFMLAVSPILFGVPHLVSDVRYLVLRPGLHRVKAFAWVVAPLIAVSLVPSVAIGLLAPAGALIAARTTVSRRLVGLGLWAGATTAALQWEDAANFVFAHGHNLVAIGLWWAWRRRQGRTALALPLAFVAASLAIVALAFGAGTLPAHDAQLTAIIAPVADGRAATALVMWFAFAQAVHYGVWLRLIPEDDRPRPAPRPFRESYRAMIADAGPLFIGIAVLAALALGAWALLDLGMARAGYLRLALFHGHLELAAIAWLWASKTKAPA